MATLVRLQSGFVALRSTKTEQDYAWKQIMEDVNPVGKHSLFTPNDNLEYFIASEKELAYDKFEATIKANGKTIKVKYNVCNQDKKINEAVRKAYN